MVFREVIDVCKDKKQVDGDKDKDHIHSPFHLSLTVFCSQVPADNHKKNEFDRYEVAIGADAENPVAGQGDWILIIGLLGLMRIKIQYLLRCIFLRICCKYLYEHIQSHHIFYMSTFRAALKGTHLFLNFEYP